MDKQICRCGRMKKPGRIWCDQCHKDVVSGNAKLSFNVKENVPTRHAIAQHMEDHGLGHEVPKELYK